MPTIQLKSNVKAILKETKRFERVELPKSFGKAIDKAAQETAKTCNRLTTKFFENPVKFTQTSFGFYKTNFNQKTIDQKRAYIGLKGIGKIRGGGSADMIQRRSEMFDLMVFGGIRRAKKKYLVKPAKHSKLNASGNFPRTFLKTRLAKPDKFIQGIPKGFSGEKFRGLWQVQKSGLKMVAKYDATTSYDKKIYPYFRIVKNNVRKIVPREFKKNMKKYSMRRFFPKPKKI